MSRLTDRLQRIEIFSRKGLWKVLLFLGAATIGFWSLLYTNRLVSILSAEEQKKMNNYAHALQLQTTVEEEEALGFITEIIGDNQTIPVIITDQNRRYVTSVNVENQLLDDYQDLDRSIKTLKKLLKSAKEDPEKSQKIESQLFEYKRKRSEMEIEINSWVRDETEELGVIHKPIEIQFDRDKRSYIYYGNSSILNLLKYFPYVQLSVIAIFIFISYLAFSASRRSEQNLVWVGMAKETAHQLGTPISSMMAWMDMIKADPDLDREQIIQEIDKDLKRLELITDRFSKIGSAPVLTSHNMVNVMNHAIDYLQKRVSSHVKFSVQARRPEIKALINISLFDWVIENLVKNAIDAMNGEGSIHVAIGDNASNIFIDISDTGKGIPKSQFEEIFKPGFTTKKRGWGLGLSLVRRIVVNYHNGEIFVKESELGKGTTFRILLKK